jgi:hypothetical protein
MIPPTAERQTAARASLKLAAEGRDQMRALPGVQYMDLDALTDEGEDRRESFVERHVGCLRIVDPNASAELSP